MNLTQRLELLREQRSTLMVKRAELIGKHKSAEVVERDLVRVTAKVLKFEARAK